MYLCLHDRARAKIYQSRYIHENKECRIVQTNEKWDLCMCEVKSTNRPQLLGEGHAGDYGSCQKPCDAVFAPVLARYQSAMV